MRYIYLVLMIGVLSGCGTSPATSSEITTAGATTGANGMTVQSSEICSKIDLSIGDGFYYKHQSVTYSTGDVWVSCTVTGLYLEAADSAFYLAGMNGASSHGCSVGLDADSGSYGKWTFTKTSGVMTVEYKDIASSHNGYTYTFSASDCTTDTPAAL